MEGQLLIFLAAYFVVVSAPVSIRQVGLLLVRHKSTKLPQTNFKRLS